MNEADQFVQFSRLFERWKCQPSPGEHLKEGQGPLYAIELSLDHVVSHLSCLGMRAVGKDTRIDWASIASENLKDLDTIERNVADLSISEEQRREYLQYISASRFVLEKMRSLPVPSEGHLGFRREVLSSFQFLEDIYHFQLSQTTPIKVRYQSPILFVELEYSPESPELTFTLGDLPEGEGSHLFSLDDFYYWAGLGTLFDYRRFDLQSGNGVAELLLWAAQLIKDHGGPVLLNKPGAFKTLLSKQAERERRTVGPDDEIPDPSNCPRSN